MKIATFNANSVRMRLPIVLDWLAENEPDLLAIQETKVDDDNFPADSFREAGWEVVFHGQKSYNGVAVVSKRAVTDVKFGFDNPLMPGDCRVLRCRLDDVHLVNVYAPNGNTIGSDKFEYKLAWFKELRGMLDTRYKSTDSVVILGDINIAPTPDDVFDSARHLGSVGHHPDEFKVLADLVDWGLTDLFRVNTKGPGHYTFWEFIIRQSVTNNLGWRIDHVYGSQPVVDRLSTCVIDKEPRLLEKPSDHTFVLAELSD